MQIRECQQKIVLSSIWHFANTRYRRSCTSIKRDRTAWDWQKELPVRKRGLISAAFGFKIMGLCRDQRYTKKLFASVTAALALSL
jgi:hypothetical protein